MIPYSRMTAMQVFEEVLLRLGSIRNGANFDWGTFLHALNHTIDEVLMYTLPLKDWAYTSTIQVTDNMVLSPMFIEPIRVLLSAGGTPPYTEARRVDVREWSTIVNWQQNKHAWNQSNSIRPVYMIWGNVLYLHPTTMWGEPITVAQFAGMMDCYMYLPRITTGNQVVRIPYDFEELVIMNVMARLLFKLDDTQAMPELNAAIQSERQKLIALYMQRRQAEARVLESFVEPKLPLVPPQDTPGELPNRLV